MFFKYTLLGQQIEESKLTVIKKVTSSFHWMEVSHARDSLSWSLSGPSALHPKARMSLPCFALIFLRQDPAENVGWPETPSCHWTSFFRAAALMKYTGLAQMRCLLSSPLSLAQQSYPHCGIHSIDLHISPYSLAVELSSSAFLCRSICWKLFPKDDKLKRKLWGENHIQLEIGFYIRTMGYVKVQCSWH